MLDIFKKGGSFTTISKSTANDLWRLILHEREEKKYKNSNSLSWCGLEEFPDKFIDCMNKAYEDMGEVKGSYKIIQTKHYDAGCSLGLHSDGREMGNKVVMITLGGDKQYVFRDIESDEYQYLNVSHGDVVILSGKCLHGDIQHGFTKLNDTCASIILRSYKF